MIYPHEKLSLNLQWFLLLGSGQKCCFRPQVERWLDCFMSKHTKKVNFRDNFRFGKLLKDVRSAKLGLLWISVFGFLERHKYFLMQSVVEFLEALEAEQSNIWAWYESHCCQISFFRFLALENYSNCNVNVGFLPHRDLSKNHISSFDTSLLERISGLRELWADFVFPLRIIAPHANRCLIFWLHFKPFSLLESNQQRNSHMWFPDCWWWR